MFYLTTHSTHFIYSYMVKHHSYSERGNPLLPHGLPKRKEGRTFLFNDALNTFYLRLYGVIHMVKDHSENETGNPLPPHRLLFFRLAARVLLYASSHRHDNTYHSLCYTSCGTLARTSNSSIGSP